MKYLTLGLLSLLLLFMSTISNCERVSQEEFNDCLQENDNCDYEKLYDWFQKLELGNERQKSLRHTNEYRVRVLKLLCVNETDFSNPSTECLEIVKDNHMIFSLILMLFVCIIFFPLIACYTLDDNFKNKDQNKWVKRRKRRVRRNKKIIEI